MTESMILGVATLIVPALMEECIFRVALLPVTPGTTPARIDMVLGWLSFVAYHLDAFHPGHHSDPRFLAVAGALGAACTAAYVWSGGSAWAPIIVHWVPVWLWLGALGGLEAHKRGRFDP